MKFWERWSVWEGPASAGPLRSLVPCHPEAAESQATPGTPNEGSLHSKLSQKCRGFGP
jgi:hypothetical protein